MTWTHTGKQLAFVFIFVLIITVVHCKPVRKAAKKVDEEWKKEEDPSYVKYLKQVIEILEGDENFAKELENVTEEDIRSGKIAEQIDFANHRVRTKLDELKRKEIESQRQLLRQQQDLRKGIHREYWNPLNDRENPNTFEVGDLKKLLSKHHEEMDEIDKKRKQDFQKYEMEKEHERRQRDKVLDEAKRKEKEEERKRLREKHLQDAKNINHPGSKSQLEEVWEEEDGLEKDQFNPRTFFNLHDRDGDGYLDPMELESLFVREASKIHNSSNADYDPRKLNEEVQRMREHVVKEIDKDKDNFVSYDEFIGATKEKDYEKPPEEHWKGIDDEDEYTDEEFENYEKEFYDDEDEDAVPGHEEPPHPDQEKREDESNTAKHVPMAHNQEQEKREHQQDHQQEQQHQQ